MKEISSFARDKPEDYWKVILQKIAGAYYEAVKGYVTVILDTAYKPRDEFVVKDLLQDKLQSIDTRKKCLELLLDRDYWELICDSILRMLLMLNLDDPPAYLLRNEKERV